MDLATSLCVTAAALVVLACALRVRSSRKSEALLPVRVDDTPAARRRRMAMQLRQERERL